MRSKRDRDPRATVNERRKRGTRIKSGLNELGDLDAAPSLPIPAPVDEQPAAAVCNNAVEGWRGATDEVVERDASLAPLTPVSHQFGASPSVFGHGWEEWRSVKQMIFDPPDGMSLTDARRKALHLIQVVWKARERKHRPLPAYVEATALLIEAMLFDESNQLSSSGVGAFYGAAISRTVHVVTGTFARGAADTYRKRASAIGFPEEAVEVRQRVAHGAFPLLSELRWVCGLVLQFLFQKYWVEQERQVRMMEDGAAGKEVQRYPKQQQKGITPRTTVEEMRQLLEELSEDECSSSSRRSAGEEKTGDTCNKAEVLQDGWRLL